MYRLKISATKNNGFIRSPARTFFHWMSDEQEIIIISVALQLLK